MGRLSLSRSIANAFDARFLRTMSAAIDSAAILDTMADDRTLAMRAPGRHRVDRTFEAVECHRLTSLRDAKGLVVVVTAHVTSWMKSCIATPIGGAVRRPSLPRQFPGSKTEEANVGSGASLVPVSGDLPCSIATRADARRRPRIPFQRIGENRLLRARTRGDGLGRKRGAKINWPSVCLSPAADSHGDGLSCVPHVDTGVHSNMSDVSVQATVSFIITSPKRKASNASKTAPLPAAVGYRRTQRLLLHRHGR